MHDRLRRVLAALVAALLAVAVFLPAAVAEDDWRSQLRAAFGLDDAETEAAQPAAGKGEGQSAKEAREDWSLPITEPQRIVNYLHRFGRLPDNFITKKEAKALGWGSAYNYVGEVAPGMSIGGDRFGNYENKLPSAKGRTWYECDTDYRGKGRNSCRLIFSSDGLYYYTSDHYNTFTQMFPED